MTIAPSGGRVRGERQRTLREKSSLFASASLIAASVFMIVWTVVRDLRQQHGDVRLAEPLSLEGAAMIGNPNATVGLVEFSDFECPFSRRFAQNVLPTLRQRFIDSGRLVLAFRNLPLAGHPHARDAAEASVCAARQGKFTTYHDLLFSHPNALTAGDLIDYARTVGMDFAEYNACLSSAAPDQVKMEVRLARQLGVSGTPAFLVGRIGLDRRFVAVQAIQGSPPPDRFVSAVESLLASR